MGYSMVQNCELLQVASLLIIISLGSRMQICVTSKDYVIIKMSTRSGTATHYVLVSAEYHLIYTCKTWAPEF